MPNLLLSFRIFEDGTFEVVEQGTPLPPPPPPAWRVRKWGDPVMIKEYGRDVNMIGTTNFQVICLYVPNTGTWSAVTNHVVLGRAEIEFLIQLQQTYGSGPADETFDQRMNWLVYEGQGTRPYWGGKWKTATRFEYGTMLWGGQSVQIIGEKTFRTSTPNNATKRDIRMGLVRMFTKADFVEALAGRLTPITHPHLIPQCAAAGKDNNYNSTPKGFTMFSPIWGGDWGSNLPSQQFYIPFECLESVS